MTFPKSHYEELLAAYSQSANVVDLFKGHRPYLEMVPSMRRSNESIITIPLPVIRLRHTTPSPYGQGNITTTEPAMLPCELGVILCDPEWKIKTGREIFIFIHRPDEDFSDLLGRWRRTQMLLGKEYEWILPSRYQHVLNEGTEKTHPLFVVFPETPERIRKGLKGAHLPHVLVTIAETEVTTETIDDNDSKELNQEPGLELSVETSEEITDENQA
jgi:hypothetical protein